MSWRHLQINPRITLGILGPTAFTQYLSWHALRRTMGTAVSQLTVLSGLNRQVGIPLISSFLSPISPSFTVRFLLYFAFVFLLSPSIQVVLALMSVTCDILPGGRFNNTYELLNLRALKFSPVDKIYIFQCMDQIFCVEFQRYTLKFHTKYLTHTLKDMIFIQYLNFKSS